MKKLCLIILDGYGIANTFDDSERRAFLGSLIADKEQERIELGKKKCTVCQEFEMLNKVSSEYKRKRQVLAEHESVSAYQTLKQVIVEKYGDKAYIDCMDEVMKKLQQQADNSGKRIISIL